MDEWKFYGPDGREMEVTEWWRTLQSMHHSWCKVRHGEPCNCREVHTSEWVPERTTA
jgi:hypothetical protein